MPDKKSDSILEDSSSGVLLCVTCSVDQFYPEIGESTVRVLHNAGVRVSFPKNQTCCGQTAFNSGFWSEARHVARRFMEVFEGELPIVFPSGSCAAMVRVFYEELFHGDEQALETVRSISPRVFEFSEYLVDVVGISKIPFCSSEDCKPSSITYHEACHLRRELGALVQARVLMDNVPDTELVEMDQSEVCCGFGGTFSVKYPDISGAMLDDKITNIVESGADSVVSCDSTCMMQIKGGLERKGIGIDVIHLSQLLDRSTSL